MATKHLIFGSIVRIPHKIEELKPIYAVYWISVKSSKEFKEKFKLKLGCLGTNMIKFYIKMHLTPSYIKSSNLFSS